MVLDFLVEYSPHNQKVVNLLTRSFNNQSTLGLQTSESFPYRTFIHLAADKLDFYFLCSAQPYTERQQKNWIVAYDVTQGFALNTVEFSLYGENVLKD